MREKATAAIRAATQMGVIYFAKISLIDRSAAIPVFQTMLTRLIETKFNLPAWRAGGVSRPRLLERLNAGLASGGRLTLISAPAGYGKTALAAEWLRSLPEGSRCAWLSLDEADNEPARFMAYLIAALQRVEPGLGQGAQELLRASHLQAQQAVLDELLNDLAAMPKQIILALDDLHLIHDPELRQTLGYLSEYQPEPLHLLLLTREDPPLPLARLRARGHLTEIRAQDLRFTLEEAQEFLNRCMGLDLNAETIGALETRTEGWAAGLQLAALALQNQPDRQEFIRTFRGSHRYVLDYLAEEVLRQQPPEIRQFLAQTAILERFNASLCQAVTGRDDARELLRRLEQANLFIVPLDDERSWHRYHPLFATFLRTELPPDEAAQICRKAAAWYEANDLAYEAVRYALASGDPEFAAGVIGRALSQDTTWSGGDVARLSSWLKALPEATLERRPRLSLDASRILYLSGHFEEAQRLLDRLEDHLDETDAAPPEAEHWLALASLYRGAIAAIRGQVSLAFEQLQRARERLPAADHLAQARAAYSLGLTCELSGDSRGAVQAYLQASELSRAAGVLFLAINAHGAAALAQLALGKLRQAEQTCRQASELAEGRRIPPLGLPWMILAEIARERNELEAAQVHLQQGLELARAGGLQDDLARGLVILARLKASLGDLTGARRALEQADQILQAYRVPRFSDLAAAYQARLYLTEGQMELARRWAEDYQARRAAQPVEYLRETEDLTLAQVLLTDGEAQAARRVLEPLLVQAQAAGRERVCLEAVLLLARLGQTEGNLGAALDWLSQALRLAAPEGYIRIFLDEGQPLLNLLPRAHQAAPEFVSSLLAVAQPGHLPRPTPLEELPEPLSEQELRVLQLIVAGKSNRQIAAELVISLGTAKWHVHNVLQKLGVSSRAQAIVRARRFGLS